jgi:23S rRNA pseudouridine955/2504/2580 synthase
MISKIKDLSNASTLRVGAEGEGQRVDNYLLRHCKGVPRSHIYRILRTGEVRVNGGRIGATRRLKDGDRVRVPPIRLAERKTGPAVPPAGPELPIAYEDDALLVIDKPSGVAVHGGSGISFGVIERMRAARPGLKLLELVHRLDRETSGLLMLAKKRAALVALHEAMRAGSVGKRYLALVKGRWKQAERTVSLPLRKFLTREGERRVSVDGAGRASQTVFRLERSFREFTLVSAELRTGRTHQIRVHLAHLGYPIAGDDKYGDFEFNRDLARRGLKRMFLHAGELSLVHPVSGKPLRLSSSLSPALQQFLDTLDG